LKSGEHVERAGVPFLISLKPAFALSPGPPPGPRRNPEIPLRWRWGGRGGREVR
jgi:hypothetical protein